MAFHYQNLLQECDLQYDGFKEQYNLILEYTNSLLNQYHQEHRRVTPKDLQNLASTTIHDKKIIGEKAFTFPKRQEKILVVNHILFQNEEILLRHIFSDKGTTLEHCYKLKEVLNELNPEDKDFLNGTMEGLVRFHFPCFNRVKQELNIYAYDEFIVSRLLELLYLSPDIVQKNYEKVKKRI